MWEVFVWSERNSLTIGMYKCVWKPHCLPSVLSNDIDNDGGWGVGCPLALALLTLLSLKRTSEVTMRLHPRQQCRHLPEHQQKRGEGLDEAVPRGTCDVPPWPWLMALGAPRPSL